MVFSTCCLALSGGALAFDRLGSGSSTFSLVTGNYRDNIVVSDVFYDVGNSSVPPGENPGLSLGSIAVSNRNAQYNVFQYTFSGKSISGVHSGDLISTRFEDNIVTHSVIVNQTLANSLIGSVSLVPYYGSSPASSSGSGWLSGTTPNVSKCSWTLTANYMNGGGSETISGSGYTCSVDLSGFTGLYSVVIQWKIDPYIITLPNFSGDTVYLNFRTVSSLKASTASSTAQTQDDILSGVNEGNQLQAETNGLIQTVINGLAAIPGEIADAIKGLFVPTDVQMEELKGSFNGLLSEKLGFVYQAVSLVDGVFDAVFDAVDNPNSDVSFSVPAFPSFDVDGTEVSLWDKPVVVNIADNEVVQTVQQVASPFVVAVMVWGFVHSMEDAFLAFVGGQSLADWVRNRKEDSE